MRTRALLVFACLGAACSFQGLSGFSDGDDASPPAGDLDAATDTGAQSPEDAVAPYVDAGLEDVDAASRPQLYRDAVIANNPLAYYRFEGSSTTAKDETGTHDAPWEGGPTFGEEGILPGTKAVRLTKDTTTRLAVPGNEMRFAGNAPFAIEAWLRPAAFVEYQWIATTEAPRQGWSLLATGDGTLHYEVWDFVDGGKTSVRYFAPMARKLLLGLFQHVVVSYDGASATLWLDGVLVKSALWNAPAPDVGSLFIGCRPQGDGGFMACLDDWIIDELAIYGHALTDADATLHYAIARQGL